MKVRALVSFAGALSMYKGEEKEYNDNVILQDLLSCRYVEEVREAAKIEENQETEELEEIKTVKKSARGRKKEGEN